MKKIFFMSLLIICLCLNFCLVKNSESEQINLIYEELSMAIIRLKLRTYQFATEDNQMILQDNFIGTAFLVKSGKPLFVVTARHVVKNKGDLYAKVLTIDKATREKKIKYLILSKRRWVFHTNNGDDETHPVDIAAMQIRWPDNFDIKCFGYNPKEYRHLNNPSPPEIVYVFGFPGDIGFELRKQRPFGRQGLVAMVSEEKFIKYFQNDKFKYANEKIFLIDIEAFPGNSGSPVFQFQFGKNYPILCGLISAANPSMDYAITEPVMRITETVNLARDRQLGDFRFWSDSPPQPFRNN